MSGIKPFHFWIIILFSWPLALQCATEPVFLENELCYVLSGNHLEFLESNNHSVESISHQKNNESFYSISDDIPNLGYKSTLWVRFRVQNNTTTKWFLVLSRQGFDQVDLYIPTPDGAQGQKWQRQTAGYAFPFSQRNFSNRHLVFLFSIVSGIENMCYMRLSYKTHGRMIVPLTIWSEQGFFETEQKEVFVIGLYYGLIIVMMLYNLFLFFSLKDTAYLYYVLFTFCLGIFTAIENGVAPQYIWPNYIWEYKHAWFIFMGLSYILGLRFLQVFLHLPPNDFKVNRILSGLIAVNAIWVIAPLVNLHHHFFVWTSTYNFAFHITIVFLVFYCWHRKVAQAQYILIAWLLPLIGGMLNNLSAMGILPPFWVFRNSPQMGYALETVLFSFALANRINLMRQEKETQFIARNEAERRAEKAEIQAKIIQQEERRKVEEMEQARRLQLSMLPQQAPKLSYLDIAFTMATATEVGGDYCDFHVDTRENVLTVALGDATGHGLQAGIIVAATKSLFLAYASNPNILETFATMSQHLKKMNLKYTNLAMILLKITDKHLQFSTAGIPPMFIYRTATGEVEEILVEGMPLGSSQSFKYELIDASLAPNDVILLMSDGLPEMLNKDEEFFGYERITQVFKHIANQPAKIICDYLVQEGETWRDGKTLNDDVTIVAIKMKL